MAEAGLTWVYVPLAVSDGQLVCLDGGAFPRLREGTRCTLEVLSVAFEQSSDLRRFLASGKVKALAKGTILRVAVNPRGHADRLNQFLMPGGGADLSEPILGELVEIKLMEDLYLEFGAFRRPVLSPCACHIPALDRTATSVNHAYTLLSEAYEPGRRSHTGNVFAKVLFKSETTWRLLESLRLAIEDAVATSGS